MRTKLHLTIALLILALLWLVSTAACAPVVAWAG